MCGLVLSHIDYSNALLTGIPLTDLNKLQRVQNFAARVVKGLKKHQSVAAQLKDLHWLPVQQRIEHKIATLVFKCLNQQGPSYLRDLLSVKETPRENLRSSVDNLKLALPSTRHKTFADRSFSVYGPKIWNSLPYNIRSSNNIYSFTKKLKTHLFRM